MLLERIALLVLPIPPGLLVLACQQLQAANVKDSECRVSRLSAGGQLSDDPTYSKVQNDDVRR